MFCFQTSILGSKIFKHCYFAERHGKYFIKTGRIRKLAIFQDGILYRQSIESLGSIRYIAYFIR